MLQTCRQLPLMKLPSLPPGLWWEACDVYREWTSFHIGMSETSLLQIEESASFSTRNMVTIHWGQCSKGIVYWAFLDIREDISISRALIHLLRHLQLAVGVASDHSEPVLCWRSALPWPHWMPLHTQELQCHLELFCSILFKRWSREARLGTNF